MNKSSGILAIVALLICSSLAGAQAREGRSTTAPARSRPAIEQQILSVQEFQENIRLEEALAAIRAKIPDFNYAVVRAEGVRPDYPTLPKMNVKNLQLGQFLDFIRANYAVGVNSIGGDASPFYTFSIQASGESVFRDGRRGSGGGDEQTTVTVHRLTPIINGLMRNGLAKDSKQAILDILSFVESVMNQSPDKSPANLKVHESTQMLTFQGSISKGRLLDETLRSMMPRENEPISASQTTQPKE